MAIIVNGKKVAGVGLPGKDGAPGADGKDGAPGKSAYQAAKEKGYTGTEEEFNTALAGMQSAPFLPLAGGVVTGNLILGVDSSSGSALYIGSENGAQVVFDSTWGLRVLADTIIFGQNSNDQKSLIFHNGQIKNLSLPGSPNDAANKQYVDEHAGARVILGSYVGTGKSGKSNPNQITLAEPFKLLCIYGIQHTDSYTSISDSDICNIIPSSIIPTEYTSGFGFGMGYNYNPRDTYGKKSADGKTFSWYYDLSPSGAESVQFNQSGTVYHYYAIV
nr:MAG TPA: nucleoid-associated protein [Caudoviricetes sp.]